jgi:hypothetical protein
VKSENSTTTNNAKKAVSFLVLLAHNGANTPAAVLMLGFAVRRTVAAGMVLLAFFYPFFLFEFT